MPQGSPSLLELKQCLLYSYLQCSEKGLMYSANWYKRSITGMYCIMLNFGHHVLIVFCAMVRSIELANSLETSESVAPPQLEHSSEFLLEFSVYWMAKSLFDLREYRRAAHTLRQCKSDEAFFLRCYSLYLVSEAYWPALDNGCPYCRNIASSPGYSMLNC